MSQLIGTFLPIRGIAQTSTSATHAVMVWDHQCLTKAEIGTDTRLEAPLKDGIPDMKQVKAIGLIVGYKPECGHIEVRK